MHKTALLILFLILNSFQLRNTFALNEITDNNSIETPKGKFECIDGGVKNPMNYSLRLGGNTLYEGSSLNINHLSGLIKNGILNEYTGCPRIISANNGYVVITRSSHLPGFGIVDYVVINLNLDAPEYFTLAEGQLPKDDTISDKTRVTWTKTGFTLKYFGYPVDQPGGCINSPKPKNHIVSYEFDSDDVTQVK